MQNGDIIEIGNYQLYLIIIDPDEIGLTVSDKLFDDEEGGCECSDEQKLSRTPGTTCIQRIGEPSFKNPEEHLSIEEKQKKEKEKFKQTLLEEKSVVIARSGELIIKDSGITIPQGKQAGGSNHITNTFEPNIHQNKSKDKSVFSRWKRLFKRRESSCDVFSSIFAHAEIDRNSHLMIQVYLHLFEETEKVKSLAVESDKNAERRDYSPLQCKLKKGDKVDVQLNMYGEKLLMSDKKSVVWQG